MIALKSHMNSLETDITMYIQEVKEAMRSKDGILIYGAKKYGRYLLDILTFYHINVDGFCVTDIKENNLQEKGLPVYQFSEIRKSDKSYLYLLAVNSFSELVIYDNLRRAGIRDFKKVPVFLRYNHSNNFFRSNLQITSRVGCPINCRYCPQNVFVNTYCNNHRNQRMSFDVFKRCIDHTPPEVDIHFSGFAEPFLNPEAVAMIEYANAIGRRIQLFTTLVGLTMEDFERIQDISFEEVVLHLPDKNHFAHIPITEDYLTLLSYILDRKGAAGGGMFVTGATAQSEPPDEIMALIRGKLDVSWEMMNRAGNLKDENLLSKKVPNGAIYCCDSYNLSHFTLLPDGTVLLCCMDWGMQHIIGNLLEVSFDDLLHGEEMTKIIGAINEVNTSSSVLCRSCVRAFSR